jgi:hypothetical protein
MSQWVPMQRVLLVHPDLEQSRLVALSQQQHTSAHPYTPIPAMLFGGAPSHAHNGCLALLLADVAEDRHTTPEHEARLRALADLRRRLLALEREPQCGAVTPQLVAEEDAIANEYRQLFVQPTTAAAGLASATASIGS